MIRASKIALVKEVDEAMADWPLYQPRSEAIFSMPRARAVPKILMKRRLGSPGIGEKLTEVWNWAKKNWPYITGGGVLYTILLIACARRPK